jgi:thiol:disulfide interchange protein DsbD
MLRLLSAFLIACTVLLSPARADDDFLPPEQAFKFSARMLDPQTAEVSYAIADGYYMYRERFKFSAAGAKLGEPQIPPGKVKFDETFNKEVETYHHAVAIRIPVKGEGAFTLNVTGQGCADKGLCYPPQDASIRLVAGSGGGGQPQMSFPPVQPGAGPLGASPAGEGAPSFTLPGQPLPAAASEAQLAPQPSSAGTQPARAGGAAPASAPSELSGIAALLQGGRLLAIIPAFILLGLGLAFTPCVLPMVPILSSIIVGEGRQAGRARGVVLSLSY